MYTAILQAILWIKNLMSRFSSCIKVMQNAKPSQICSGKKFIWWCCQVRAHAAPCICVLDDRYIAYIYAYIYMRRSRCVCACI